MVGNMGKHPDGHGQDTVTASPRPFTWPQEDIKRRRMRRFLSRGAVVQYETMSIYGDLTTLNQQ